MQPSSSNLLGQSKDKKNKSTYEQIKEKMFDTEKSRNKYNKIQKKHFEKVTRENLKTESNMASARKFSARKLSARKLSARQREISGDSTYSKNRNSSQKFLAKLTPRLTTPRSVSERKNNHYSYRSNFETSKHENSNVRFADELEKGMKNFHTSQSKIRDTKRKDQLEKDYKNFHVSQSKIRDTKRTTKVSKKKPKKKPSKVIPYTNEKYDKLIDSFNKDMQYTSALESMYLNQTKENMYADIIKEKNEEIHLLNVALQMKTSNYDELLEMFNELKKANKTSELQQIAKERPEERYMSMVESTDRKDHAMVNRLEFLENQMQILMTTDKSDQKVQDKSDTKNVE